MSQAQITSSPDREPTDTRPSGSTLYPPSINSATDIPTLTHTPTSRAARAAASPTLPSSLSTPSTSTSTYVSTPSTSASTSRSAPISQRKMSPEEKVRALEDQVAQLRAQLGDRDPATIIKAHIERLHTYNEIKDGTQALIGRYAALNEKTIKEVHVELGLPLTD